MIYILDTETTGLEEPELVQVSYLKTTKLLAEEKFFSKYFKPSKPISLAATSIHHIFDEDVESCPPSSSFTLPDDCEYLIGHNIDFDWKVIGSPNVKRICTLALSRFFHSELAIHTQTAMVYYYYGASMKYLATQAHNALIDVRLNNVLIQALAGEAEENGYLPESYTIEQLWELSEKARVPFVMPFGNKKGTFIADLPLSDIQYWLNQPNLDPYLKEALFRQLKQKDGD